MFSKQRFTICGFGIVLVAFFIGISLTAVNYVPNVEQSDDTIFGMQCIMIGLPSFFFAIALFIYFRFYKLNGAYLQKIENHLMEKYDHISLETDENGKQTGSGSPIQAV